MKNSFNNFFKTSDDEQIFYRCNFDEKSPPKNVLVFNYGLVCSHQHWQNQIDYLDEKGFPILLHDYRGHFQSSGKEDIKKINFKQITNDLHELISYLKLEDIIMLGHSMGVNICLEYAKDHQANIQKMVLLSGSVLPVHNIMLNTHLTGAIKNAFQKVFNQFPNEFNEVWKKGGWIPAIKKMIHMGGFNQEMVSDEFIEIYLNKIGILGPDLFFQLIGEMQTHDILAFLSKIKTNSLIIGGNKDKVIPNYLQRILNEHLDNSELYIVHKGSHVPQVDFPLLINERLELFLS